MQPCAHARMHAPAERGQVLCGRFVPSNDGESSERFPRAGPGKKKREQGQQLAGRGGARRGGQTPARPAARARTHAHLWKLKLASRTIPLTCRGDRRGEPRHARPLPPAGPRARACLRLRVPTRPATNRAQGYAGSGGSLGPPAL
jgi:hypothetical protein